MYIPSFVAAFLRRATSQSKDASHARALGYATPSDAASLSVATRRSTAGGVELWRLVTGVWSRSDLRVHDRPFEYVKTDGALVDAAQGQ